LTFDLLKYQPESRAFCCEIHSIFQFSCRKRIYRDVLVSTTAWRQFH